MWKIKMTYNIWELLLNSLSELCQFYADHPVNTRPRVRWHKDALGENEHYYWLGSFWWCSKSNWLLFLDSSLMISFRSSRRICIFPAKNYISSLFRSWCSHPTCGHSTCACFVFCSLLSSVYGIKKWEVESMLGLGHGRLTCWENGEWYWFTWPSTIIHQK